MSEYVATDLHGHSLLSDGRIPPEEFVRFRAARNFEVIALSDHDTFAGVRRAAAEAAIHGLTLVPAMEASSFIHFGTDQAEQVHVLAYYSPALLAPGALEQTMMWQRAVEVARRWRNFVVDWMYSLPTAERLALDHDGSIETRDGFEFPGLQSMINQIMDRHPVLYDAFRRHHVKFWTQADALFGWSPEQLIDTIRADGGLDIVAHPGRCRDKARMRQVLEYASGLEVYTSRHRHNIAAEFRAYAEANGKHWTASSDDHQHGGKYVHPPHGTPRATVDAILAGGAYATAEAQLAV